MSMGMSVAHYMRRRILYSQYMGCDFRFFITINLLTLFLP